MKNILLVLGVLLMSFSASAQEEPTKVKQSDLKGPAFKNYPKDGFYRIRHMALDRMGNIWIAATDGLMILDADDNHSPV